MELLYRGFDGLDIAFQGQTSPDLCKVLEKAKSEAQDRMEDVLAEYRGVQFHVAETGSSGGFRFRCSTGPDGAIWFFKKPNSRDPWGIRVSVRSLSLALYGLGGVRARLYAFLDSLGVTTTPEGVSVGRVDYAMDFLMPGFELMPDNFVMHSHTNRADHEEAETKRTNGRSGRVTSVTVGKMPGRQVIVYDKRAEVIEKRKVEWWEIWNVQREQAGLPLLDPTDREGSQVWRVELRGGKRHLKDRWGIGNWSVLDDKLGDVLLHMITDIRYTTPSGDTNRARWPDDALWQNVRSQINIDLFEMSSGATPGVVKAVIRQELGETLLRQAIGLSATLAVAQRISNADTLADYVSRSIRSYAREKPLDFEAKQKRAEDRYKFL